MAPSASCPFPALPLPAPRLQACSAELATQRQHHESLVGAHAALQTAHAALVDHTSALEAALGAARAAEGAAREELARRDEQCAAAQVGLS